MRLGGSNVAIRSDRVDVDGRQNRDTTDAKVALVVELVLAVIVNVGLAPQAAEVLHAQDTATGLLAIRTSGVDR